MFKPTTLLILFTLVTLVSCSQKGSNVKLEVSHNFLYGGTETSTSAGGGLMVWGQSSTGASFGKSLEGSDEINFQLPNGTWTFYAMVWDGSSDYQGDNIVTPLGGNTKCAKSAAVTLGGNPAVVDLTVNSSTCFDPVFKGAAQMNAANPFLPKVQFNFCSKVGAHITGPNTICADTINDPKTVEKKAPVTSFRVKMRNHFSNTSNRALLDGGVTGACIAMTGDSEGGSESSSKYGASTNLMPNLPAGGPGLPFHFTLEMFVGSSDCDASVNKRGMIAREFVNGAASISEGNKYFPHGEKHRQYVALPPEVICNPRKSTALGDHSFAAGLGTQESPYIICSVPQWHAINNPLGTFYDKHFKLQSDLDFNPFSKGFGLVTSLPSCVELGTNFIPVGYSSPTCSGTAPDQTLTLGTSTTFTGSLEGAGHTIKNLRLRAEDESYLGLFAKLSGIAVEVKNLNIEKAEISGLDYVAGLAGYAQDISYIFNVRASNLDVESRENVNNAKVGSILGSMIGGTLEKIIVSTSKVRGESSMIGGIVGYASGASLKSISSEVNIDANGPSALTQVGGVVGRVETSLLDFVKHEGGITTNGTEIGGIAGSLMASSLTNFYTISSLYTIQPITSNKMGGVVGYWDSTGTFGKGYSLSNVKSQCLTSCIQGGIVGSKLSNPGTIHPYFALSDDESGAGAGKVTFSTPESIFTFAQSTTPATFTSFPNTTTNDWHIVNGQYPRFDFEKHPCLNSPTGNGTITSPRPVCNLNEYINLKNSPAGTYHKLLSNIRFPNVTISPDHLIPNFYAHLDGAGKAIIGGDTTNMTSPNGHIGQVEITASIKNLKIFGLTRKSPVAASEIYPNGVFVAHNYGLIENIEAHTNGDFIEYGSGVVGQNLGTMKKISFHGLVKGTDKLTTLAVVNSGIIQDSVSNGEVRCKENAGCDYLTGLVVKNEGFIKRTEVNTRISEEPGSPANNVSLLVDENYGLIENVFISKEAQANISGTTATLFHRINDTSGSLNRVINFGSILSTSSSYMALPGFPLAAEETAANGHTSVLRGGISGIKILENVTYTCATNIVTVLDWSFVSSAWNPILPDATNLILKFKFDNETYTTQVSTFDGVNKTFTLPLAPPSCSAGDKVSIYYTTDVPDLPAEWEKVLYPHESRSIANFSAAWQPHIWDTENNPTHMNEMLSYFKFILGVSTTPVVPRAWEIPEGEDIELFLEHKN